MDVDLDPPSQEASVQRIMQAHREGWLTPGVVEGAIISATLGQGARTSTREAFLRIVQGVILNTRGTRQTQMRKDLIQVAEALGLSVLTVDHEKF